MDYDDPDIQETLRAAGVSIPTNVHTEDDHDQTLKEAGITRSVERSKYQVIIGPDRKTPKPSFNEQMSGGMPIVGPLMDKAVAATGAMIQPFTSKEAPSTFGERYSKNLENIDQRRQQYSADHPILSPVANLLGATIGTAPLAATKLGGALLGTYGPTLGSKIFTGGAGNALIAGTDAALRGEDPIKAAEIGGIVGAVSPVAGQLLESGISGVANYLWPRRGAFQNISPVNVNRLSSAIEGETPASILDAHNKIGPSGFLGDINPAMTDLMGGLADTPGPHKAVIREAVTNRALGQRNRINTMLTDTMGPRFDVGQMRNMITEERAAAADPLYAQFRETQVHPTAEIKALIPRLQKAGAFKKAQELSDITGEPLNMNFFTTGDTKSFPTTQTWDYIKQALDSRISAAYEAGDKVMGRALVKLRNDAVSAVEKAPGGKVWKQARNEFAEHSHLLDNLQAGRDTFLGGRNAMTADELRAELSTMSQPERVARIAGARMAAAEAMGSTLRGDSTLRNQLLSPNNQEKLKILLGENKGARLIKALEQEAHIAEKTSNIIGNMNTGASAPMRSQRVRDLQAPPVEPWNLDLTKPFTWLPPVIRRQLHPMDIHSSWRGQRYADANNQLASLLLTRPGPQMNDLINAMMAEGGRRGQVAQAASRAGNLLTGALSAPAITTYRRANP